MAIAEIHSPTAEMRAGDPRIYSRRITVPAFAGASSANDPESFEEFIVSDDELIDGIYKLVMCIATGGSSQVWEVVEQASGRHLAMKLLKTESPDFKENKIGLKHEAEVLKSLEHPMIIKFEKFSSNRDNTYLTMEHFARPT